MDHLDTFGRDYLRLALEINKHFDGYIDAYLGPAGLKAEVEVAPQREPTALLEDIARLQALLPTADPNRHAYLTALLRGMECTVRIIAGETFDYLDEVAQIYDIQPQKVDEVVYEAAYHELDSLLPGSGSVAERLEARRQHYLLPNEKILPLLELARDETRRRTAGRIALPEAEGVEVRLTNNQHWSAYNWYLGNGRSLIEFNTDIPLSALQLLGTFAHEGYPGHHTEGILKEQRLLREKGYAEAAVMLLHSPTAVISEAIAVTALEMIFTEDGAHEWNWEVMLPAAALTPYQSESAAEMSRLSEAQKQLRTVSANAAILHHTGQLNREQAIEYLQTYNLSTRQRAEKSYEFMTHPLSRNYVFTYTIGYDLFQQATANSDPWPLFGRLLTEQVLPSQLNGER
jgi:hypothetical protein